LPALSCADDLPSPPLLSADFIKRHSGDNHAPAVAHRAQFPDGRVGSHSALGLAEHGVALVSAAAEAASRDYAAFLDRLES